MERIAGFAWPLPRAFSAAVSACRFEQGDVLYGDAAGYEAWEKGGAPPAPIIQVLDPPRSARALPGDAEGTRFRANWDAPVTLELTRGDAPAESRTTTQGRLFSCLWHGDLEWLDEAREAPEPPIGQRDLHRQLQDAVPAVSRRLRVRSGLLFLFATDDAGDAARVKAHAMESLLAEAFQTKIARLGPAEAGVPEAAGLHPALLVVGIAIKGAEAEAVEERLKGLLYAGAEGKTDRFSLSRHGLLVELPIS